MSISKRDNQELFNINLPQTIQLDLIKVCALLDLETPTLENALSNAITVACSNMIILSKLVKEGNKLQILTKNGQIKQLVFDDSDSNKGILKLI